MIISLLAIALILVLILLAFCVKTATRAAKGVCLSAAIGLLIMLGAFHWNCLFNTRDTSYNSTDNGDRLRLTTRLGFPRSNIFDPSTVLRAELYDHKGAVISSDTKILHEDSDYQEPKITWSKQQALIEGFDDTNSQTIILKRR